METFQVNIQAMYGYTVEVSANDEAAAIKQVREMDISEIKKTGSLKYIEIDYAEID